MPKRFSRGSLRLKNYDYSLPGMYFVTLATWNREGVLGKVVGSVMRLSKWGSIVRECWGEIPKHFPNVILDMFVVMPNHIHGIVSITDDGRRGTACRAPTYVERFGKPP